MRRSRKDDPAQLTLFAFSRVERTGVDAQGNATFRVVPEGVPTEWIRPARLARALGFNVRTIYGWIDSGIIPADRWERRGPKSIFILASEAARLRDTSEK
ncbi:hypothetical protein OPIT5_29385 [Opitutaceae bacterium TAV5]|nr:hypothetical protein OPIT5_21735 [Opitutaceae bacterium TAV5]AHF93688.1 hypothetical protein OPIT5_29385 [Opitutaceae bacterium TAV5]